MKTLLSLIVFSCTLPLSACHAADVLFEDTFDGKLSDKWEVVGLENEDYRVRNGALEIRLKPETREKRPMLKVALPFTTEGPVIASVEVSVVDEPLGRGEMAGLRLLDAEGPSFTVRKTNIDGYFVLAPGEPEFIGQPGDEGDPSNFTVKYWPAVDKVGPLRIIVRGHYAYFQTGPTAAGKYQTYFHSAIREHQDGLAFALFAVGDNKDDQERWVRFDNFKVTK